MFFPDKDRVFQNAHLSEGHWQSRFQFDESVARVFDDMALRSIPLYRETLDAIADWTRQFAQAGSTVFDLGCSTGSATIAAMSRLEPDFCHFVGIDTSAPMLDLAAEKTRQVFPKHQVSWRREDVAASDYRGASVVLLNYTLQFVPSENRLPLLQRIYDSLPPRGLLLVSDKLAVEGSQTAGVITERYHRFKEEQGYTKLEVERKRAALENVLVPFSLGDELALLRNAGFDETEVILKWNQFASFVVVKT